MTPPQPNPSSNSEELLPCPFCGGQVDWRWHSGDALWLECSQCCAIGPQTESDTCDNSDATAARWNARVEHKNTELEADRDDLVEQMKISADACAEWEDRARELERQVEVMINLLTNLRAGEGFDNLGAYFAEIDAVLSEISSR